MQSIAARLVAGLIVANAFVYLVAGSALLHARRQQEANAQAITQNLARSVAITVSGMLDKLDLGLSAVATEVAHELREGPLEPARLNAYLARQKALMHDFEDLWIADGTGALRWGTNMPAGAPVNVADREYVQRALRASDSTLVISDPLIGKVNGTWVVIVAKRINRADGSFVGIAMGSLRLVDCFKAIFAPIDLGEQGMVALRAQDMTLLARYTPGARPGPQPGTRSVTEATWRALRSDPVSASYVAVSALDGVDRTLSYRRLDHYPLYVFVGRETRELLAPWISEAETAAGLLLLFTLATGLYSWANFRRARAHVAARDAKEMDVQLQRQRLQTILDSAPVGIAFSAAGRLQFGNAAAIVMFGDCMGSEASSYYVDAAERAEIETQLKQGRMLTREVRMLDRHRRVREMLVTYVPTTLNEQAGVLVWLIDITERKRSEEQIQQANLRNDTALGLTRAGYWEVPLDGSGRFLPSQRAAEIFGIVPHADGQYRLAEHWLAPIEAVDPQTCRAAEAKHEEMIAGRLDAAAQLFPFRRPIDGRVVWIQGYGKLARDAEGQPATFYGAVQDVTEHVRVREELAQAKDAATAATRAKSEFLANMSHEIRTPLNAILGLAHLLRRDAATPREAQRLQQIQDAGEHLLALVSDVLDLSKIEAGRLELECVEFGIEGVLREAVAVIGPQARAKGLRLVTHCGGLAGCVRGDPTRLRQALLNYLSNAVKFTPRGGVTLRCRVQEETAEHLRLRFEVQDSGIGIAAERIPSLFRPFEQVDASAARTSGGTGLGLAITRHLAEMMGGAVGVESKSGEGSLFWFTVCLAKAPAAPCGGSAPGPQAEDAVAALRLRHGGARVLLAEDNAIGAEVATDLLQEAGLQVEWARDGAAAVAMARSGDYALVLMDMQMPGVDGLQAARAIRRLPGWALQPIVALTANAFAEDRRRCLEAGMNDFLPKPVKPDELYRVLARWLDAAAATATGSGRCQAPAAPPGAEVEPPETVLHFERIAALPGMDGERLREFQARRGKYVRLFEELLAQCEAQQPVLLGCLAGGDAVQAQGIAHSLKGAAALLGAQALARATAGLEQAIRDDAGEDALGRALEALQAALRPLRGAAAAAAPTPSSEENDPCTS